MTSIFFIDKRVNDYAALIDSLPPGSDFCVIESDRDGLEQIADYLSARRFVDAIHIISHGDIATLYLGKSVINSDNLQDYEQQLESISASLSEHADILLYGCNVGQSELGQQFVNRFAHYTGADVAASSDLTVLDSVQAHQTLEITTGTIDTHPLQKLALNSPVLLAEAASAVTNPSLGALVNNAIADNVYSYQEMLNLLNTAAASGLTASEWSDLKTVYNSWNTIFASDYLKTISYNAIFDNVSNAKWWGGSKSANEVIDLGNLSAGSSETHVRYIIDKWFLGLDLPMPIAGGDTATGRAASGIYDYLKASGPVFVNGAAAQDVNQGASGTCYLLAALGSIANANPSYISDAITDNGNGSYGVRFYFNGTPVYTTVNTSLPTSNGKIVFSGNINYSLNGELWVSLLEKAYAQMNTQFDVDNRFNTWRGENSYQAIEGGNAQAIKQFSNLNYTYYTGSIDGIADEYKSGYFKSSNPTTYKQTIINALNNGSVGWLATFGNSYDGFGKQNFVNGHAFMLLGYNSATDKFIIRNPWGGDGTGYWNPQFEASIDEFWTSLPSYLAISDPAITDPVFNYTLSSPAANTATAVSEGSNVIFNITRSNSGVASTVYLSTQSGSADSNDFGSLNKLPIRFSAFETSKTINVNTYADTLSEGSESFSLNLYKNVTDTISAATATAFIKDPVNNQNYTYTLSSNANSIATAKAEGTSLTFTVNRSGKDSPSTVYLTTSNGSASDDDYVGLHQYPLEFSAFETTKTVSINLNQDNFTEDTENFFLNLYKNIGDNVQSASAAGFIQDVFLPSYNYTVTSSANSAENGVTEGGKVTFTITRSGSGTPATVYVSTVNGTAGESDYAGFSNRAVTFAANQKIITLDVETSEDWWLESDENFSLDLYKTLNDSTYSTRGMAYIKDKPVSTFNYTITSSADSAPVSEGASVTFTITRSGTGSASTVYVSTADGSADAGDYAGLDKYALDFAAFETEKSITINTYQDNLTEGNENFWLKLYRNYADSSYSFYGSATIQDSVSASYDYTITSNATSNAMGEGGAVTFTITRSNSGSASTVYLSTFLGTADDSDYAALDKYALNFAAFETSKTININTYQDGLAEDDEYFFLELFDSYADALDNNWASYGYAYIQDSALADYSYRVTSKADYSNAIGEGNSVTFNVTRSGSGSASTVYLSTFNGSADDSDYATLDHYALNFAAFETSKTITINTYQDGVDEENEYFYLELFNTYADLLDNNWASYGYAYIQDSAIARYDYTITSSAAIKPVGEGGIVTYTITRDGAGSASTVYLSTLTGSADEGDYAALDSYALSFAASETSKTITVNTYQDGQSEENEYFFLGLFDSYADAINNNLSSYGISYIQDSVVAGYSYSLDTVSINEGEMATFTITRSGSGSPSTVYLSTYDGTSDTSDYEELDKYTLEFAASETSKTISISTYEDDEIEGKEYFFLELFDTYADAINYNWDSYGVVYLQDVAITNPIYSYNVASDAEDFSVDEGGKVTFTITRDTSGTASTVYLSTYPGTADETDYASLEKVPLQFSANETTKTISVDTFKDNEQEDSEFYFLLLFNSFADAGSYNWASYGYANIQDITSGGVGSNMTVSSAAFNLSKTEAVLSAAPATETNQTIAFPGHNLGAFRNDFAFAALKTDGSVVTWGNAANGGDSALVTSALNGEIDTKQIFSSESAFAALREDGSVVTWGNANAGANSSAVATALDGTIDVAQVFSTTNAFAALRSDGSVVTWGTAGAGGDSSGVSAQLNGSIDVVDITSTSSAFAALRADGSVVSWGFGLFGGDSTAVASQLSGDIDVSAVFATGSAFAVLRNDGSVVTWGNASDGGNSSDQSAQLNGTIDVRTIYATTSAFAALRNDGSLITWGDINSGGNSSSVADKINGNQDVIEVVSTSAAFAALRADGSVVSWGDGKAGGNASAVAAQLDGSIDVVSIVANDSAFAALRADGSVVTWGFGAYGGNSSAVASQLNGDIKVKQIVANDHAFAALRVDGSVVAWGEQQEGGSIAEVQAQLDGTMDVSQLYATSLAFAAVRSDGSVITWGNQNYGGDSSSVTAKLNSVTLLASLDAGAVPSSEKPIVTINSKGKFVGSDADERFLGSENRGADNMSGGGGDDTYVVDNKSDKILESSGEAGGHDEVKAAISYKLAKNVENLTLIGSAPENLSGTGNELDNYLVGDAGDNLLEGSKGLDKFKGGAGNDTYLLDQLQEIDLIETANGGFDTLKLNSNNSGSYRLADHIEQAILTGNGLIDLVGNDQSNSLLGNSKSNQLEGGFGNDTLNGGSGSDRLIGGEGNDVFVLDRPLGKSNVDSLLDFGSGVDSLQLDDKIFTQLQVGDSLDNVFVSGDGAKAIDTDDYLIYDTATGKLFYDVDGLGKKSMVLIGVLVDEGGNPANLLATDISVI